jgi:hypothetical protein
MKSFKQIVCLAMVVLITTLFALQAAAERPRTREIRDKLMWGDPDEMGASRKADGSRYIAVDCPARDGAVNQPTCESGVDGEMTGLCVNKQFLSLEIRVSGDTPCSMCVIRR